MIHGLVTYNLDRDSNEEKINARNSKHDDFGLTHKNTLRARSKILLSKILYVIVTFLSSKIVTSSVSRFLKLTYCKTSRLTKT